MACRGILAWLKDSRGASAVEFALIAPVVLIMMLGLIEFGRAFWIKSTLQFAVEEAGRYNMVYTSKTEAEIKAYAEGMLPSVLSGATVTATEETTGSDEFMSITATFDFDSLVPLLNIPTITLQAKSRVPVEIP